MSAVLLMFIVQLNYKSMGKFLVITEADFSEDAIEQVNSSEQESSSNALNDNQ